MLHFICRVGNNYGVIDTDDGIIDWVSKDQLIKYSRQLNVVGGTDLKPVPCTIDSGKCNWDNKRNIFTNIKSVSCLNGRSFILYTNSGRKFKGEIVKLQNEYMLHFNCNVFVPISLFVYRLFIGGNSTHQQLVEKLRTSGGQSLS